MVLASLHARERLWGSYEWEWEALQAPLNPAVGLSTRGGAAACPRAAHACKGQSSSWLDAACKSAHGS